MCTTVCEDREFNKKQAENDLTYTHSGGVAIFGHTFTFWLSVAVGVVFAVVVTVTVVVWLIIMVMRVARALISVMLCHVL